MTYRFQQVDPHSAIAARILDAYGVEMKARYGDDAPYGSAHVPAGVGENSGRFVVVTNNGEPIACAGLRMLQSDIFEIKAMFVAPDARRTGVGRALLKHMEQLAVSLGAHTVRLNTGANQPEALQLYRNAGYTDVAAYNDNAYANYWLQKSVTLGRDSLARPGSIE